MSLSSILGLGEFTGEEFHKDHILVTIRLRLATNVHRAPSGLCQYV